MPSSVFQAQFDLKAKILAFTKVSRHVGQLRLGSGSASPLAMQPVQSAVIPVWSPKHHAPASQ
jgi:hypothetical protein